MKQRNIVLPRRNFKMKVKITKTFHDLKVGDEMEKVTMVKGTYSGYLKGTEKLMWCPHDHAEPIY